jgi:hypothetical protein
METLEKQTKVMLPLQLITFICAYLTHKEVARLGLGCARYQYAAQNYYALLLKQLHIPINLAELNYRNKFAQLYTS